jgi:C-terminal peptidase (prc)
MSEEKVKVKLDKHKWADELEKERKKRRNTLLVSCAVLFAFIVGAVCGVWASTGNPVVEKTSNKRDRLDTVYDIMLNQWYFGKDIEDLEEELINMAILGMSTFEVDPNTAYMTSKEAEEFMTGIEMTYVGIGVQYRAMDGQNIVEKVFRESPAEKAGVLPGDIFYKVDGVSLEGLTTDEISAMVKGESGTVVVIEFYRQGETVTLEIVRGPVNNSAYGYMITDNIGYLEISQFGSTTGKEVGLYLESLVEEGAEKIIIDLRSNSGGYLTSVVSICSYFLEEGSIILIQEDRDGRHTISRANNGPKYDFSDIVLLVDGYTASAAEVMAAALRDNIGATLVGVNTFGKGTVQVPWEFSDGSIIKYTTSEWLTPNEEKIHNVGIKPDVIVELHPIMTASIFDMGTDEQYKYDDVSEKVKTVQMALDFLGYNVDRQDGYFSYQTDAVLKSYQTKNGRPANGIIDEELYNMIISDAIRSWSLNKDEHDSQLKEAIRILNGK